MKIVLFGANGQLGNSFKNYKFNNHKKNKKIKIFYYSKKKVDITNKIIVKKIIQSVSPNYIINCAAYTNVDDCEKKISIASKINSDGPKVLAKISKDFDIPIIHFSTDYVYNGKKSQPYTENDYTEPLNVYGKTKLRGEENIIINTKKFIILRLSWLFSEFSKSNFPYFIFKNYLFGSSLNIINDQIGKPTCCEDVVHLVFKIIKKIEKSEKYYGVYNFASIGPKVSWDQYSKIIIKHINEIYDINKKNHKFKSINLKNFNKLNNLSTKRPKYSVLNSKKAIKVFEFKSNDWRISLIKSIKSYKL